MNRSIIISLTLLILVVGAFYYSLHLKKLREADVVNFPLAKSGESFESTFYDVNKMDNFACESPNKDVNNENQPFRRLWKSGGNYRSQLIVQKATYEGGPLVMVESNILNRDGKSYLWVSMGTQLIGYVSDSVENILATNAEVIKAQKAEKLTCKPFMPLDNSKFSVPDNVTFEKR